MKKITEQIISYDTAKLANKKGFDISCQHVYFIDKSRGDIGNLYHDIVIKDTYCAPTQSMLQKWLREKHDIHIIIHPKSYVISNTEMGNYYYFNISGNGSCYNVDTLYPTYEDALEKGLLMALQNLTPHHNET